MSDTRLAFVSSKSPQSQAARESLEKRYAHVSAEEADVIIAKMDATKNEIEGVRWPAQRRCLEGKERPTWQERAL